MKTYIFRIIIIISILSVMVSCRTNNSLNVNKVLMGTNDLYTAYNIFYYNKQKISSINYRESNFIPLGTKVKNIEVNGNAVSFDIAETSSHVVIYYVEKWGKQPISCFVKQLITHKNRQALLAGISQKMQKAILKGTPQPGMTKREIILTLGPPSRHKTPLQSANVWIYWLSKIRTQKIYFLKDKVITINGTVTNITTREPQDSTGSNLSSTGGVIQLILSLLITLISSVI